MRPYEKFLENSITLRQLLDTYLELRQHFQELGFSEPQLEKPPKYTPNMLRLFDDFSYLRNALLKDVNSYGFDMSFDELTAYLTPLLKKINELTPLKEHGNNQRSNRWDED
jgi:hypothetical protein